MTQSSELWMHSQSGKRYIIPKEQRLESGDYPIRSVTGRALEVNFDAVKPFAASENDVQIFMMTDLKLALLQKQPTIHPLSSDEDDSSDDGSDFEDESSEESDLESALLEALGVNEITSAKLEDAFTKEPGLIGDLIRELEPELEDLRDSVASFGVALSQNQDASAAEVLRALGEKLIAQADLLESELAKTSDSSSE
jgi:hypothetical protein